ncbi:endoglucanase EG-1 precursor [Thozetella sp. PMI_491]|nr:endoglucanase EG-1 precursor [Thozetella sp. PMI_491]
MATWKAAVLPLLFAAVGAQLIGNSTPEVHPKLPTQFCTKAAGCVTRQTTLVTDALSRNVHKVDDLSVSCVNPTLSPTLCPDAATCAQNCALEGVDYTSTGVLTQGTALTLRQYVFDGQTHKSVSPRLYLLAEDDKNYEGLKLVNQELSFDVDVSKLACGMNGALYLSEMDLSGSRSAMNPAGAQYGTGYCDAQCPALTFMNGMANRLIREANSASTAFTPHTCSGISSFPCTGTECNRTVGVCDKNGCGLNQFALGNKNFYGPGMTVDTKRPFTVVTQFVSSDNTASGTLSEIRRLYIQNGKVIDNEAVRGPDAADNGAITENFCVAHNSSDFVRLGGLEGMGKALSRGMVLIFSLWNSDGDFMNWLDSGNAGPCSATAGDPKTIVANDPDVSVTFSNIKWGDIGTTFNTSGQSATVVVQGPTDFQATTIVFRLEGGTSQSKMTSGVHVTIRCLRQTWAKLFGGGGGGGFSYCL